MNEIILKSPAKVNLFLDVFGKREDGYHELKTIFHKLELHDLVWIKKTDSKDVTVKCSNPYVPEDEKNICWKVANSLKNRYDIESGLEIDITKKIPVSGGLGGGSSNGAKVMEGMDKIFDLGLSDEEKIRIGSSIGADLPVFIKEDQCIYAEGIGDVLKPLNKSLREEVFLIDPMIDFPENFHKTKWAYQEIDKMNWKHPKPRKLIKTIENGKEGIFENLFNVFEDVMMSEFPEIESILNSLRSKGINSILCGSGPTVIAFSDKVPEDIRKYGSIIETRLGV
ncbi:MAG: 4-(cytidine 5'-diphospho)-2-C-methyl-D-erythritol kinase [Candidatus Aenigmatarchaeota archaeon]